MAGRDEDRAADLHAMLGVTRRSAPIFCLQGGYGSPRLIPLLDEARSPRTRRRSAATSDLTMLHLAAERWGGHDLVLLERGVRASGAPEVTEYSKRDAPPGAVHRRALRPDRAGSRRPVGPDDRGRASDRPLTGGCAGLLARAIGTRLQPDFRGQIVFLEEIDVEGEVLDGDA